jgi:hypothetical protein
LLYSLGASFCSSMGDPTASRAFKLCSPFFYLLHSFFIRAFLLFPHVQHHIHREPCLAM